MLYYIIVLPAHSLRSVEAEHTTLKSELPALRAENDELRKVR